jgi:hypothetical protein
MAAYAALSSSGHPGTLVFPPGVYAYNTTLVIPGSNLRLVGDNAVLWFRGSGVAVSLAGSWSYGVTLDNLIIRGTSACTTGLSLDLVRHSTFSNLSVQDVTARGVELLNASDNVLQNLRVSADERAFVVQPTTGLYLGATASHNVIVNLAVDGVSVAGVVIENAYQNLLLGGHARSTSTGVLVTSGTYNTCEGFACYANTSYDYAITASHTSLRNCLGISQVLSLRVSERATQTVVERGGFYSIYLAAGSYATTLVNTAYSHGADGGSFTDYAEDTLVLNGYNSYLHTPQTNVIPGSTLIAPSAGAIGFYGTTPIVRPVLATGAGRTVDQVITVLQNLGLVKQI